ncbi:GNAT family N-acetyltransferase [Klebsiella quasipneumoniae]|uniref:GNAT family N-acetyltransferase n=1 Tax=Klebsiella quasipneumoniae TaxID=1463165 RepID=UPI001E444829|nr:GNAT family N-acetyltransferase [Klebsiella quasipneumoniae]MCE0049137.1 GNAT family N-acetyltransferase [Klebsiella quasipneumoniae subsp. quasipneumoniae]
MNIIIASPERAEECWTVRNQAIRYGCKNSYSDTVIEAWTSDQMPDGFRNLITKDFFFIGQDETGKIIATAFLDKSTNSLKAFYVLPEYQGKGIGTIFLTALLAEAKKSGMKHLELSSTPNARFFYENRGFVLIGEKAYTSSVTGTDLLCFDMHMTL